MVQRTSGKMGSRPTEHPGRGGGNENQGSAAGFRLYVATNSKSFGDFSKVVETRLTSFDFILSLLCWNSIISG
jgi:hypothetical protein